MSADAMDMHQTWQEFIAFHSIRDSDEVYSNGIEFVPVWRVEQMMAHYHDPLKAENAKLRELEGAVNEFLGDLPCNDCARRRDCDDNNRVLCNELSFHAMEDMRRLASRTEVE